MLRRGGQRKGSGIIWMSFSSGEEQALKIASIVRLRDRICNLEAKFN
jgi:hypothetical protein